FILCRHRVNLEGVIYFDDPTGSGRRVDLFRCRFWIERRVPTTFRPGSSIEPEVVRFPLLQRVQKRYWPIAYRPAADSSGPPDFALLLQRMRRRFRYSGNHSRIIGIGLL